MTPFVEGRLAGGVIGGSTNQPITIPGTGVTMQGASAATWIYGRGLDAGAEFYLLGRTYVSVALGWLRTTWGNADYTAMVERGAATIRFSDVTHDSFLLKIGLGF